jgi:hypothetical protein
VAVVITGPQQWGAYRPGSGASAGPGELYQGACSAAAGWLSPW